MFLKNLLTPPTSSVVGGRDDNDILRVVHTDSSGNIQIVGGVANFPTVDAADGSVGAPAPVFAIQIGAVDPSGKLQALKVDNSGNLLTSGSGGGGAVTITGPLGHLAMVNSVAVAIASDQTSIPVTDITSVNTNTTTGDAPTIVTATTVNGATQTNANARGAIITAILGTVSGTLPTLSLQLQWSPDGGTTWLNYGSATSAIAIATGNTVTVEVYPTALALTLGGAGSAQTNAPLPRTWRMAYTTTGTGISIAVASVQVNYCI